MKILTEKLFHERARIFATHQELKCIRLALTAIKQQRILHEDVRNLAEKMEREISHYLNPTVEK